MPKEFKSLWDQEYQKGPKQNSQNQIRSLMPEEGFNHNYIF
jgi:hypothetical protein